MRHQCEHGDYEHSCHLASAQCCPLSGVLALGLRVKVDRLADTFERSKPYVKRLE